jgi:hypothetical protein
MGPGHSRSFQKEQGKQLELLKSLCTYPPRQYNKYSQLQNAFKKPTQASVVTSCQYLAARACELVVQVVLKDYKP